MTLVWRARALNDLRSLFAHIARHTDPGHAYDVLADLRTRIEALLDQPALGRRGHQRGTRYLIVRVGTNTYRCLYHVSGQRIICRARARHAPRGGLAPTPIGVDHPCRVSLGSLSPLGG